MTISKRQGAGSVRNRHSLIDQEVVNGLNQLGLGQDVGGFRRDHFDGSPFLFHVVEIVLSRASVKRKYEHDKNRLYHI